MIKSKQLVMAGSIVVVVVLFVAVLVLAIIPLRAKSLAKCETVKYQGEQYQAAKIGNQCWMAKNLNVGNMIIADRDQNLGEKYCYDNKETNCDVYGGLYQWNAIMNSLEEGTQGICPDGWHVPTDNDWKILERNLGMPQNQVDSTGDWRMTEGHDPVNYVELLRTEPSANKEKAKSSIDIKRASKFNLLFAGILDSRGVSYYEFDGLNKYTGFWSSTVNYSNKSWARLLRFYPDKNDNPIKRSSYLRQRGLAVRCVKEIRN